MRRLYLISYDISSCQKRWRQVFKILRGHGDHLQYSVFLCELNLKEKAQLVSRLEDEIKKSEDQIIVIDLGPLNALTTKKITSLGIPYTHLERHSIVV